MSLAVQTPDWQVSVWVHPSRSLQLLPLAALGFEQTPFAGLQLPAAWQTSLAVQTTGFEPVHVPD